MMKIKAEVSFAGVITMAAGEVRDVADDGMAKSLIASGYASEVKADKAKVTKKGKKNEG